LKPPLFQRIKIPLHTARVAHTNIDATGGDLFRYIMRDSVIDLREALDSHG
jgi:hypothetical protein